MEREHHAASPPRRGPARRSRRSSASPSRAAPLASPSSSSPGWRSESARSHADSTTSSGARRSALQLVDVQRPVASSSDENSGLSARKRPWQARWARAAPSSAARVASRSPRGRGAASARARAPRAREPPPSRGGAGGRRRAPSCAVATAVRRELDPERERRRDDDRPPAQRRQRRPWEPVQRAGRDEDERGASEHGEQAARRAAGRARPQGRRRSRAPTARCAASLRPRASRPSAKRSHSSSPATRPAPARGTRAVPGERDRAERCRRADVLDERARTERAGGDARVRRRRFQASAAPSTTRVRALIAPRAVACVARYPRCGDLSSPRHGAAAATRRSSVCSRTQPRVSVRPHRREPERARAQPLRPARILAGSPDSTARRSPVCASSMPIPDAVARSSVAPSAARYSSSSRSPAASRRSAPIGLARRAGAAPPCEPARSGRARCPAGRKGRASWSCSRGTRARADGESHRATRRRVPKRLSPQTRRSRGRVLRQAAANGRRPQAADRRSCARRTSSGERCVHPVAAAPRTSDAAPASPVAVLTRVVRHQGDRSKSERCSRRVSAALPQIETDCTPPLRPAPPGAGEPARARRHGTLERCSCSVTGAAGSLADARRAVPGSRRDLPSATRSRRAPRSRLGGGRAPKRA